MSQMRATGPLGYQAVDMPIAAVAWRRNEINRKSAKPNQRIFRTLVLCSCEHHQSAIEQSFYLQGMCLTQYSCNQQACRGTSNQSLAADAHHQSFLTLAQTDTAQAKLLCGNTLNAYPRLISVSTSYRHVPSLFHPRHCRPPTDKSPRHNPFLPVSATLPSVHSSSSRPQDGQRPRAHRSRRFIHKT